MKIELIGFLFAAAGAYAMFNNTRSAIYILCFSTLLGAAAALKLESVGGASIQPFHFMLVFIVAIVSLRPMLLTASLSSLQYPGPGFWLMLFTAYGALTAVFLPRLFENATVVYSIARGSELNRIVSSPLAPTSSNFTQSVYLLGNLGCFAIVSGIARLGGMVLFAKALIVTAVGCLAFAVLDFVTYKTGTAYLLSVIRNANYRMLDDGDIAGFKRIVGSFSEAGVFGYVTLALFSFVVVLILEGYPQRALPLLAAALLVALLLCTSTTAYVASAAIFLLLFALCVVRILRRTASIRHLGFVGLCTGIIPLAVMTVLLTPHIAQSIGDLLSVVLANKLETQSGEERMRWNAQALISFIDTSGLGAGLGSIRTSSFVVALLANVGIVGAVLFVAFMASLVKYHLKRRGALPMEKAVGLAALVSSIAQLIAASISAAAIDLGPLFTLTTGLAAGYALGPYKSESHASAAYDLRRAVGAAPWSRATDVPVAAVSAYGRSER
ncbi:hypothetical protein SAMN03159496_00367 [Rhizobium sp. NFR07]|nr:hypothetical protein SAMN03159496_00367 [Rhizobium sp. NFR07]